MPPRSRTTGRAPGPPGRRWTCSTGSRMCLPGTSASCSASRYSLGSVRPQVPAPRGVGHPPARLSPPRPPALPDLLQRHHRHPLPAGREPVRGQGPAHRQLPHRHHLHLRGHHHPHPDHRGHQVEPRPGGDCSGIPNSSAGEPARPQPRVPGSRSDNPARSHPGAPRDPARLCCPARPRCPAGRGSARSPRPLRAQTPGTGGGSSAPATLG